MAGSKIAQYVNLLINLLPRGKLWQPREQPVLTSLLTATAQEICRVGDRVDQLLIEVDPRITDEALDQWEAAWELPDECTPEGQSADERRTDLLRKITNLGGLSKSYYEEQIEQLGYTATVFNWVNFVAGRARAGDPLTNYFNRHFIAGSTAGTPLTEIGWRYYFNVDLPATAVTHFVAGSLAGEALQTFSNPRVECVIRKLKPAHAGVTFTFN